MPSQSTGALLCHPLPGTQADGEPFLEYCQSLWQSFPQRISHCLLDTGLGWHVPGLTVHWPEPIRIPTLHPITKWNPTVQTALMVFSSSNPTAQYTEDNLPNYCFSTFFRSSLESRPWFKTMFPWEIRCQVLRSWLVKEDGFLTGKSHGQRGLEDCSLWSPKRVKHVLATNQQQQQKAEHNLLVTLATCFSGCLALKQKTWVQSLGQEDTLEKEMATHSGILAWEILWTEEPGRLQTMVMQRV